MPLQPFRKSLVQLDLRTQEMLRQTGDGGFDKVSSIALCVFPHLASFVSILQPYLPIDYLPSDARWPSTWQGLLCVPSSDGL